MTIYKSWNYQVVNFYGNGNIKVKSVVSDGGADYAEYFEWDDGKILNEDRIDRVIVGM